MAKGRKTKEVEQLINMEGEKGFLPFDEASELPPNDIVSSDQIDDVLMMFDEMDIDVVEDLQGLKVEEGKAVEKEEEEGDEDAQADVENREPDEPHPVDRRGPAETDDGRGGDEGCPVGEGDDPWPRPSCGDEVVLGPARLA